MINGVRWEVRYREGDELLLFQEKPDAGGSNDPATVPDAHDLAVTFPFPIEWHVVLEITDSGGNTDTHTEVFFL